MQEIRLIPKPATPTKHFFQRYLDQVPPDGQLLEHLQDILDDTVELMTSLPPEKLAYRYAPGKWTLKDMLVHLLDCERIFTYRALRFARNDQTELPGFEESLFAEYAHGNDRELDDILSEFKLLRASTIAFISSLDDEALARPGTANGMDMTALTLVNLVYGHHKHHWGVIHDKYL